MYINDCAELQRKSATTEAELQRKSAQRRTCLVFSALIMRSRRRTPKSTSCSMNLRTCKKSNGFNWKQNCFEAERRAASMPVFADGPSTVRFATPVEKVTTVADFHSPDMSLSASAGNMNLKTRTAGQTMVINARRRLGMKTAPQPVAHAAAKVEAQGVSRPVRRMRSKGPLQQPDSQLAPNPGGEPPIGPEGHDQLADGDARGSGGVPSPPGLPVRPNPGGPPGDSGDDGGARWT